MKAQLSLEFLGVLMLLMIAAAGAITYSLNFQNQLDSELSLLSDELSAEALAMELSSTANLGDLFYSTKPLPEATVIDNSEIKIGLATSKVVGAQTIEQKGGKWVVTSYKHKE